MTQKEAITHIKGVISNIKWLRKKALKDKDFLMSGIYSTELSGYRNSLIVIKLIDGKSTKVKHRGKE